MASFGVSHNTPNRFRFYRCECMCLKNQSEQLEFIVASTLCALATERMCEV
eukprot:m.161765 g.161765  ORF g.161765 m.161765 type:complete len:51 (+) comp14367_c1_seq2:1046-1198(+)